PRVAWIGRKCWPTFQLLQALGASAWLKDSLFLDPATDKERLWVIGEALRCPGIHLVIADGCRMNHTASRRLQLAAEKNNALGFLARPMCEQAEPSCAHTRWEVSPCSKDVPGWSIRQLSCRGQRHGHDARQDWTADWSYQVHRGTGTFHLLPRVGRGSDVE